MKYASTEEFVEKQLELLRIERNEEINQNLKLRENLSPKQLQTKGICILKLCLQNIRSGLYGRTLVSFESKNPNLKQLPSSNITTGDIVGIFPNSASNYSVNQQVCSGVISSITSKNIEVALDSEIEDTGLDSLETYTILQLANDITNRRIKQGLNDLRNYHGPANALLSILFGSNKLSPPNTLLHPSLIDSDGELFWQNPNLDESQKRAVKFALLQKEIAIIHGPPGTGKTTTIVEIILQIVKTGSKVLVCAPSNTAVDNLLEKLIKYTSVKSIRLGHPTRVYSHIQHRSLDAVLAASDAHAIVSDVRKELDMHLKQLGKAKKRVGFFNEIKSLRRELRVRESKSIQEVLSRADVILSTLTSASKDSPLKHLLPNHFDCVVIDECSQAIEAACWLTLSYAPKIVLAGDHLQLPPTVLSQEAEKKGLGLSLMERILNDGEEKRSCVIMLTTQYRMHKDIMIWASKTLYNNELQADFTVENHLLCHLPGVTETEDTTIPLLLIDTAGCDLSESSVSDEGSRANPGEATLVAIHARRLIQAGLATRDIAIITPYNLQVDLLKQMLAEYYPDMEIRSVDGFQGREKEAVILSLVRSNVLGQVGFVADIRRFNVAVTRARRHLCVITDSATTGVAAAGLLQHIEEFGEVRSAHQYPEIDSFAISNASSVTENYIHKMGLENLTFSDEISKRVECSTVDSKNEKTSTIDLESTTARIKDTLIKFLRSPHTTVEFSPTLLAVERKIVHELAGKYSLRHESIGEDKQRRVIVSKILANSARRETLITAEGFKGENETIQSDVDHEVEKRKNIISRGVSVNVNERSKRNSTSEASVNVFSELKGTGQQTSKCSRCNRDIPTKNMSLHELQCSKVNNKKIHVDKKKAAVDKSLVKPLQQVTAVDSEDFDQLLSRFQKLDSVCSYSTCKKETSCLGQICRFCNRRFCLPHHMPEIHGCGEAVRQCARSALHNNFKVLKSSHAKMDATKRVLLQKKLDDKIDRLATMRKGDKSKKK